MQNKRLIIVGGGQAGSSIARGVLAREMYRHVCVVEPDVLSRTDLIGFINQRVVSHSKRVDFSIVPTLDDALFDRADMLMLATPVAHFGDIVRQIAPRLRPGAVITDVGSSKQKAMASISGALQAAGREDDVWLVGGHPGTGRSGQGPMSSDPDMYKGQPVFLVMPDEQVPRMDAQDEVFSLWDGLGADVRMIDAFSHDQFFGLTSHFQHLAVFSLMAMAADGDDTYLTHGYQDARTWMRNTTRIANANVEMWLPVFEENRDAILSAADGFLLHWDMLGSALERQDIKQFQSYINMAHTYRISMADAEPREGLVGELADWSASSPDGAGADCSEGVFSLTDRFDCAGALSLLRGTMLPSLMAAAMCLNARSIDGTLVHGVSIAGSPNPSFLDGTAPMLSDPGYMSDFLYYNGRVLRPAMAAYQHSLEGMCDMVRQGREDEMRAAILQVKGLRGLMPPPRKGLHAVSGMEPVRPDFVIDSDQEYAA